MKKIILFFLLIFTVSSFVACKNKTKKKEVIKIYAERELHKPLREAIRKYEKEKKVNVEIKEFDQKNEKLKLKLNDMNLIVSYVNLENEEIKKNYRTEKFFRDDLVVIGYRNLISLGELKKSTLAITQYGNEMGRIVEDELSKKLFFNEISKDIEYKKDIVECLESVDLYEEDFAIVSKVATTIMKNAKICFMFSDKEENKLQYNLYVKLNANDKIKDIEKFLLNKDIIEKMERVRN